MKELEVQNGSRFPKYWGLPYESAFKFLERMEFTALMKDRSTPEILSQILTYCLQGDAKAWLQMYVTTHRNAHQQDPEYRIVRAAFLTHFARVRSPNDVLKVELRRNAETAKFSPETAFPPLESG